ncbi:MAG: HNH endonuclease [Elusimicrobia bacterium]|nr:HNH endonuclease [Elusimicrobiota bacterium]
MNRNFYAIQVATWERALTLLYLDRASVVDDQYQTYNFSDWLELSRTIKEHPGGFIHTPYFRLAIPDVIALKFFDEVPPAQEVPFTRRNIYQHYGYRCCYCGRRFPTSELNLDHVIPRSRGGATDWSNIVTACIPCNLKKANRLPAESGMRLIIPLTKPKAGPGLVLAARSPVPIRSSWQRFIDKAYWDSQLETDG